MQTYNVGPDVRFHVEFDAHKFRLPIDTKRRNPWRKGVPPPSAGLVKCLRPMLYWREGFTEHFDCQPRVGIAEAMAWDVITCDAWRPA